MICFLSNEPGLVVDRPLFFNLSRDGFKTRSMVEAEPPYLSENHCDTTIGSFLIECENTDHSYDYTATSENITIVISKSTDVFP